MKKRKVIVIVSYVFFLSLFSAELSYAIDPCDLEWQQRIDDLKSIHGDRMRCSKAILFEFFISKPFPEYGKTCRLRDTSSQTKRQEMLVQAKEYKKKCGNKGFYFLAGGSYINAKYFFPLWDSNQNFREMLPPAFKTIVPLSKVAFDKGYLTNERWGHGLFWSLPEEGVVSISVYFDTYESKLKKSYYFLTSIKTSQKLSEIVKAHQPRKNKK